MPGDGRTGQDPATGRVALNGADPMQVITEIEQLRIQPDHRPDRGDRREHRTLIVMGGTSRVSTVAIAQGNLTVRVTETPPGQPSPNRSPRKASPIEVPRTDIQVDDGGDRRTSASWGRSVSLQKPGSKG